MTTRRYLLTKLAEEAAEVAQAACKALLSKDTITTANLEGEVGDLLAFIAKCHQEGIVGARAVSDAQSRRRKREDRKGWS